MCWVFALGRESFDTRPNSDEALVQLFKRSLGTETARVAFRHLLQTFTRIDADKMVYLK